MIPESIENLFSGSNLMRLIQVISIIGVGYFIIKLFAFLLRKALFWKNLSKQTQMLLSKSVFYSGFLLILLVVSEELGLSLKALLGAAGVIGIVIGIASQTSFGNIVSGLFLVSEKPFELGDAIKVGDKVGIVEAIDLLSIKIRTLDNLYLRIPNQTIISTELINITRYPIRRMDFNLAVAYKDDLEQVMNILKKIAEENKLCLEEPEPLILFKEFGQHGIELLFGVWFEKTNYLAVKNSVFKSIKKEFDEADIEIPFPQLSLHVRNDLTAAIPK